MTTLDVTMGSTVNADTVKLDNVSHPDNAWVTEILGADNLRLADSRKLEPYGRAQLGKTTRILMWGMRVYVVLSFVLIAAQIYISLKPH